MSAADQDVFVGEQPENCPECEGDLELQGKHGQMQCTENRDHQFTWASYELASGAVRHELVSGNKIHARTEVSA